jgi:hypothetical protein
LETLDPDTQHSFCCDFELAQEAMRSGITAQRVATRTVSHWQQLKNGDPKYDNFSIGHHTTWMRIWPFHKWRWNGL